MATGDSLNLWVFTRRRSFLREDAKWVLVNIPVGVTISTALSQLALQVELHTHFSYIVYAVGVERLPLRGRVWADRAGCLVPGTPGPSKERRGT
jgi:hypothetical protein